VYDRDARIVLDSEGPTTEKMQKEFLEKRCMGKSEGMERLDSLKVLAPDVDIDKCSQHGIPFL